MLSKLAFKNVKRSFKDYIIYLITITLAFAFMFAFNLITTSKDVVNLCDVMSNFESAMYVVNSFILIAICFLINYTTKFMFSKRSKEFGTYMLLGINKKQITGMFTLENILLGFFSLIISIPIGYLISLLMSVVIMNFFELPQLVKVVFNLKSVLLLILYFVITYFIVLFLSRRRLRKMKIKDLLYFEKQNEKPITKKKIKSLIFVISLILGVLALALFDMEFKGIEHEPSMSIIMVSVFLIIISIYGVSITISDFILSFILNHRKIKYTSDNLFVARSFYSKVKTMSFTIGTLSFLIILTLISLNISSLFKGMFDYQLDTIASYDIAIEADKKRIFEYLELINREYTIEDKYIYNNYIDESKNVLKILDGDRGWRSKEQVMKLSDYNKLLKLKNDKTATLAKDEYILHVAREYKDKLGDEKKLKKITLSNGKVLKQKQFINQGYSYAWGYGYGYIIVVPDSAVENLNEGDTHLIINTKERTTEAFAKKLAKFSEPDLCEENDEGYTSCYSLLNIIVRGQEEANNKGFMTISSFVCFYIALIFTAIVGTILAIELLFEATKYKYRYQVLSKLGVGDDNLDKTIFKQLWIFFVFPIIYPIIVSFLSIRSMNKIFKVTLTTDMQYLKFFFINILIFTFFYLIYFLATYFGFKKNIHEEKSP